MEGCGFRDLQSEYQKKNAVIYGISYDTPAENKAFAEKYRFTYPLLSDPQREIAKQYGAFDPGEPDYPKRNTYVIGVDGKLEKVIEKVQAKFHAQKLLEQL